MTQLTPPVPYPVLISSTALWNFTVSLPDDEFTDVTLDFTCPTVSSMVIYCAGINVGAIIATGTTTVTLDCAALRKLNHYGGGTLTVALQYVSGTLPSPLTTVSDANITWTTGRRARAYSVSVFRDTLAFGWGATGGRTNNCPAASVAKYAYLTQIGVNPTWSAVEDIATDAYSHFAVAFTADGLLHGAYDSNYNTVSGVATTESLVNVEGGLGVWDTETDGLDIPAYVSQITATAFLVAKGSGYNNCQDEASGSTAVSYQNKVNLATSSLYGIGQYAGVPTPTISLQSGAGAIYSDLTYLSYDSAYPRYVFSLEGTTSYPTVSTGGTGSRIVSGLCYTSNGVLFAIIWNIGDGLTYFAWSADLGATWNTDGANIADVPALANPPALAVMGDRVLVIFEDEDTPVAVYSDNLGVDWDTT